MPSAKGSRPSRTVSPVSRRNASTFMWTFPCCRKSPCPPPSAPSVIPASKSLTRASSGCWRFFCTPAVPSAKLKGHGLLQRDGRRYAYRLTAKGVDVARLFPFFHKRLCGPLANSRFHHKPDPANRPDSKLEAACHKADKTIEKPTRPSRSRQGHREADKAIEKPTRPSRTSLPCYRQPDAAWRLLQSFCL